MSLTKTSYSMITGAPANALDFGAIGDGVTDDTAALQLAITTAWKAGKPLYIPTGTYLISATLNIPPGGGYEYRADVFTMYGDGGSTGFISYTLGHGTTIFTNTNVPILTYTNYKASGNDVLISKMRFQQNNAAATQPVLYFQIFAGASRIEDCNIRQDGLGDGIKMDYAYGGTLSNLVVMNKDLVAPSSTVRVGTALNLSIGPGAGGLLLLERVSGRGFLNAFNVGYTSNSAISTRFERCEASTVTNGFILNTGLVKTVVENAYFEGVSGTCIQDQATGTTVSNGLFFGPFTIGIDGSYGTFGNVYYGNQMYIGSSNCIGISIASTGDAVGRARTIDSNYIYYTGSGVTGDLNLIGVKITGSNPNVNIVNNTFRPRRAWVGGDATTIKILDSSTGVNTGIVPLTDTLNEFPLYSNINISLANGGLLTQTSVTAGVLAMGASSFVDFNPTVATNVNQLSINGVSGRIVLITCNTNATLVDGPFMILAGSVNFTGSGQILLNVRILGGVVYAYEISRTAF